MSNTGVESNDAIVADTKKTDASLNVSVEELQTDPCQDINALQQDIEQKSLAKVNEWDLKNQESLKNGQGRLGYRIGEGRNATFIFAEPFEQQTQNPDGTPVVRKVYVGIGSEGIYGIQFQEGTLNEDGTMGHMREEYSDSHNFAQGENSFKIALEDYARTWNKPDGTVSETFIPWAIAERDPNKSAYSPFFGGNHPKLETYQMQVIDKELGYRPSKTEIGKGIEGASINLPRNYSLQEEQGANGHVLGMIRPDQFGENPKEKIDEAVAKSTEAAQKAPVVSPSKMQETINLVESV